MAIEVRLTDLNVFHPSLIWDDIAGAAYAVSFPDDTRHSVDFGLTVENVPGFGSGRLSLKIERSQELLAVSRRIRRTYDRSRVVELAAIAIAGVGLYYAGGHQIRDVALRGSAADYLVDDACLVLEVAGRSRRNDLESAWHARWTRLSETLVNSNSRWR